MVGSQTLEGATGRQEGGAAAGGGAGREPAGELAGERAPGAPSTHADKPRHRPPGQHKLAATDASEPESHLARQQRSTADTPGAQATDPMHSPSGARLGRQPQAGANIPAHSSHADNEADPEHRYRPQKYCAVCGDKAIACNFNAVTCESCKAFFRRNAFKEQQLKCLFENRCIIDRVTRRFCSKCRLLKCFQIGMKREWILTDEQKQIKRIKILQNKQSRQHAPTSSPTDEPPAPHSAESFAEAQLAADNIRLAGVDSARAPHRASEPQAPSESPTLRRICNSRQSGGKLVETKDAATCCPDESDLLNGHLIHYCSLAYQCQFCSIRLAPPAASAHQHRHNSQQQQSAAQMFDYHHHHQHYHHHHAHHQSHGLIQAASRLAAPYAPGAPAQPGQLAACYIAPEPNSRHELALDGLNEHNLPRAPVVAQVVPCPTSCCCLDAITATGHHHATQLNLNLASNEQSHFGADQLHTLASQQQVVMEQQLSTSSTQMPRMSPQLHILKPPQVCVESASASASPACNLIAVQSTVQNQHPAPLAGGLRAQQQPLARQNDLGGLQVSTSNSNPSGNSLQANHRNQLSCYNPFVMALEARSNIWDASSSTSLNDELQPRCRWNELLEKNASPPSSEDACGKTGATNASVSDGPNGTGGDETLISNSIDVRNQASEVHSGGLSTPTSNSIEPVGSSTTGSSSQFKSGYIVWNGEFFYEPATNEAEVRNRVERFNFSDSERQLIYEMIEATKTIFDRNDERKLSTPSSLDDIVYFCDAALRRLIKVVKQIKAFRILSMDDQIILLKTACFKILLLRSTYHYNEELEGWMDAKTGKFMRLSMLKRAKKSLVYEKHKELTNKMVEPLRKDRMIMSILSMALLFDPSISLKHANSVGLDNLIYLSILRKYLLNTQPDPLAKYERLVAALQAVEACNEEYNVFFSKDFQPEQVTPLLIEIFDISINNSM